MFTLTWGLAVLGGMMMGWALNDLLWYFRNRNAR